MLKRRVFALLTGIALLMVLMGASGVVADSLGLDLTPQAFACSNGSGGGGDC
jgi:hypothetical protein